MDHVSSLIYSRVEIDGCLFAYHYMVVEKGERETRSAAATQRVGSQELGLQKKADKYSPQSCEDIRAATDSVVVGF